MATASRGINKRKTSQRHPLLQGRDPKIWHEDLVGLIPQYPKTLEEHTAFREKHREVMKKAWAEGKLAGGRRGVPDGWAGRKPELERAKARAAEEAKGILEQMEKDNLVTLPGDDEDAKLAREALLFSISVVRAKSDDGTQEVYPLRDRIAAAGQVLRYTKAPPASTTKLQVSTAEDFLNQLAVKP